MKPKLNRLDKTGTTDRCQSPMYAVDPILPHLRDGQIIWEPCAGDGNLVRALQDSGYQVKRSDILTGQDFFTYKPDSFDVLVTNPPYSLKYKFLSRCYDLEKPFALLVPVEVFGAKAAQVLFEKYGFEVIFLRPRVNFTMPQKGNAGSAQFPTCWITWGLRIGKEVSFFKLNPRPDPQLFFRLEIGAGIEAMTL